MKKLLWFVPFLISGCVGESFHKQWDVQDAKVGDRGAQLPNFKLGDSVTYTSGRKERVKAVNGVELFWRRSSSNNWVGNSDFFLPNVEYTSKSGHIKEKITYLDGDVWPLRIGKAVDMHSYREYRPEGYTYSKFYTRHWKCKVEGTSRVKITIGEFDTYVVRCDKIYDKGQKITMSKYWHYSPLLRSPLAYVLYRPGKEPYAREVMHIRRGMKWLEVKERKSLSRALQRAMESNPVDKVSTWVSKDGRTRVQMKATNTLRLADGTYCRNYTQEISYQNEVQYAAGLVCRKHKNRWSHLKKMPKPAI